MKNVLMTYNSLVNGAMTGNLTSEITDIRWLDNMVIYIVWTGTPTGTFVIETSPDRTTWYPLNLYPIPTATGVEGNHRIHMQQLPDPYIRARYTFTSGSGTANITIAGKLV